MALSEDISDDDPPPDLTVSLELVKRAQDGEREALNRLFERYYERVRRIVRLRLGQRLRTTLESGDILQDTFAAAVRAFDRFEMRDEASLIHWLSKLAEHQITAAADYHGAKKRDRGREVALPSTIGGSGDGPGFALADGVKPPGDGAADKEQSELVETCIGELSEEYRELIILRNYVGASWHAVAQATGRPSEAAARMMHARALIELGKLVRARGGTT